MYNYYVDQVREQVRQYKQYEDAVEYLYRKYDQLNDMLRDLEYTLQDIKNEAEGAVDIVFPEATKILEKYALLAMKQTVEFDLHQFRSGLLRAIRHPDTIQMWWDSRRQTARIEIDLDLTAGSIYDYARAIDLTREQLRIGPAKPSPMSPDMASYMWMEKYYKPAREGTDIPQPKPYSGADEKKKKRKKKQRHYNRAKYVNAYKRTIRTRISNFRKPAPFWRILNYGSQPLTSDWGGYGYPSFGPTYFVERAKKVISAKIAEQLKGQNDRIANLRSAIEEVKQAKRYVNFLLNAFQERILNNASTTKADARTFTRDQVQKQLGARLTNASLDEITQLVNDLYYGKIDPNQRITLRKKSGGSFRVRIKRLYNKLQEYRNS